MKNSEKQNKLDLTLAIKQLLRNDNVGTQEEICHALEKLGHSVNQAKISRTLHKLGAIKMVENNRTVYRLPVELITVSPGHSLRNLILSIESNDFLIVIQTTPGSAQLVARVLDHHREVGILGTVAGDDTIFIAPKKTDHIKNILKNITQLLQG